MAQLIQMAAHARARRVLQLLLRRHGLEFFLLDLPRGRAPGIDGRKVELVLSLSLQREDRGEESLAERSCRGLIHRLLRRRLDEALAARAHHA